jgi:hypothetical protein
VAKKKDALIFSVTDYWGNLVELSEQTWSVHICAPEGHPQMIGYENLVKQILRSPYEVRSSTQAPTGAVFISHPQDGPSPEGIRAVVNYKSRAFQKGSTTGIVTTAYPVDLARYPTPKIGRVLAGPHPKKSQGSSS